MKQNAQLLLYILLFIFIVSCKKEAVTSKNYIVTTLPGDFTVPSGLAADNLGNVYVVDALNRVCKITSDGKVNYFFAGSGEQGYDDGPAASAKFKGPIDVAINSAGEVYVADQYNYCIRKIKDGLASTFAGNGAAGYVDGVGTAAKFNNPSAISTDASGNLYVADYENKCLRKITASAKVSTVANSFLSNFGPLAVTIDGAGNIYEQAYSDILKITPDGTVSPLNKEAIFLVRDIVADDQGNIFYTRSLDNCVYKMNTTGDITTIAGSKNDYGFADGSGSNARFNTPLFLARDKQGNIYVSDVGNDKIRKISFK